jgi:hypothetical protein
MPRLDRPHPLTASTLRPRRVSELSVLYRYCYAPGTLTPSLSLQSLSYINPIDSPLSVPNGRSSVEAGAAKHRRRRNGWSHVVSTTVADLTPPTPFKAAKRAVGVQAIALGCPQPACCLLSIFPISFPTQVPPTVIPAHIATRAAAPAISFYSLPQPSPSAALKPNSTSQCLPAVSAHAQLL